MGEIAEMMLDGTLCEGCGTYLGQSRGFPGYCSRQCAADRGAVQPARPKQPHLLDLRREKNRRRNARRKALRAKAAAAAAPGGT